MSRTIATRAIRGANALVNEAEAMLDSVLKERGPETPVAFPNTAYHLPLIFGMILGASLGGNLTPFGASANVVAVGLLRKEGIPVSTREFVKIGLPFTLVATGAGAALLWLIWT